MCRLKLFLILAMLTTASCNLGTPDAAAVTEDANDRAASSTSVPAAGITPTACSVATGWFSYTVVRGDSLTTIAARSDSTVAELIAGNCLLDPDRIQVGETIYTPNLIGGTPGVPVTPTATDTVQFYLIAEGGAGSGIAVGCDDGAVPVLAVGAAGADVPARINAALSALFAVPQRAYGQSGLVNELADSDLRVDVVSVSGGVAQVQLSGQLVTAGVCADARIEAQIVLTIFQFPEVDEALITLAEGDVRRNLRELFDGSGLSPDDFRYQREDWTAAS